LYLVSPTGDRYPIAGGFRGSPSLIGWTADAGRALVSMDATSNLVEIDLHTGAQTTIPGLGVHGSPAYADGDGTAFLVSSPGYGTDPGRLIRVDHSGNTTLTYPTDQLGATGHFAGQYLVSPDGTRLVLATSNQGNEPVPGTVNSLVVLTKQGSIIAKLPSPMPKAECEPVKWWQPTVILTLCYAAQNSARQLWKLPLDGGTPTALTAANSEWEHDPGFAADIGEIDAWQLRSGTFLRSQARYGTEFLSRLTPDMYTTRVNIPGVSDDMIVVGAAGGKFFVRPSAGRDPGNSLLVYDPVANTATVLLGPPVNGGAVTGVLLFPDRP
jgi:TolB protein